MVRLDNRSELERCIDLPPNEGTDLELVMKVIESHGSRYVHRIIGDFAFFIWHTATHTGLGARDACGVRRLYYTQASGLLTVSSSAQLLEGQAGYDMRTLLEVASLCLPSEERSPFAGVQQVPAGHSLEVANGTLHVRRFWGPENHAPMELAGAQVPEACETFRELLKAAVRSRLTDAPNAWAQLSGGLDSSSVVSTAQWLHARGEVAHGLAGTISWVYRWSPDSDEREYSGSVLQHYPLRNEVIANSWFWEDDALGPPLTDWPCADYPLYARERRTRALVRDAGGSVMLTGFGSDHYLLGNMFFFADWIAQGRMRDAFREMLRRASLGRVSLWALAYQNALLPLLPGWVQGRLVPGGRLPPWIRATTTRALGLSSPVEAQLGTGGFGEKYAGLVRQLVHGLSATLVRHEVLEEELDVRHPFLYRPLLEWGLRLPPLMCVQPHARKWVLREAMTGILPELVRCRVGKGSNPGCVVRSLIHERPRIERLLRDPLLAQSGHVDPVELRTAYTKVCNSQSEEMIGGLLSTLAVETWLQARSDRWASGGIASARL